MTHRLKTGAGKAAYALRKSTVEPVFGIIKSEMKEIQKEIQGWTTDFVVAKDGTVMHGLALIYVLRAIDGVAQFKIIQESLDRLTVLIVPSGGLGGHVFGEIKAGLRQRLGPGVQIEIVVTDNIPIEASGKFRYVVSKVSSS